MCETPTRNDGILTTSGKAWRERYRETEERIRATGEEIRRECYHEGESENVLGPPARTFCGSEAPLEARGAHEVPWIAAPQLWGISTKHL